MPRTDREDSRDSLMKELLRCGFSQRDADQKVLGFSANNLTSLDVFRIKLLVAEVRQKFESYGQRFENALKTERLARQEVIEAIKKLVEDAESPEKRPFGVLSPQQLAEVMEELDRPSPKRNGYGEPPH